MALKSTVRPTRLDIPHEPGEWIEYKPLSTGEFTDLLDGGYSGAAYALALTERVLTAWSYDIPLTPENIRGELTADVFRWVDQNVMEWAGLRSPDQKNESNSPSSPISDQATDSSQPNSDT